VLAARQRRKTSPKKIGVGRTVLANYEAGRRLPDSSTLEKLEEFSGHTVAYVLTGMEAHRDPFEVIENSARRTIMPKVELSHFSSMISLKQNFQTNQKLTDLSYGDHYFQL
jgi:transcriptional regulator with XRE-family HTH domain